MSGSVPLGGKCLCGAVSFTAKPAAYQASVCHCTKCRTWAGGPFIGIACESDPEFVGEDNIGVYPSSAWAERGFCKTCGTSLFWRLRDGGGYVVTTAAVGDPPALELVREIFVDEKPDTYAFVGERECLTGAQVFAMYTSGGGAT